MDAEDEKFHQKDGTSYADHETSIPIGNVVGCAEERTAPIAKAEIHWYEAHGIGKVKLKVKQWL
jgi:hypothetical protein